MITQAYLRQNCPSCFRANQMDVSCVITMYFGPMYTLKNQEDKEATFCFLNLDKIWGNFI